MRNHYSPSFVLNHSFIDTLGGIIMKILGRNVKVYRNDDVHSALEFKERVRNSFDDEGLTFATDGQIWETDYREDTSWDEGFRANFIIINASFVLYKKYRNVSGGNQIDKYSLHLENDVKINHELIMKIEQSMLELINAG